MIKLNHFNNCYEYKIEKISISDPYRLNPSRKMQSHKCWRVKMHIYTYIHFCINSMYIHYVLGLDLATTLREKGVFFLINKACHVRWPCVTQSDSSFYLPPRARLDSFPKLTSCFADCLFRVFTLHVTTRSESLIYRTLFLWDPAQPAWLGPSAVMSSLGDRRRCCDTWSVQNSAGSLPPRHDIISTWSAFKSAGLSLRCHNCPLWCHTPRSNDWRPRSSMPP